MRRFACLVATLAVLAGPVASLDRQGTDPINVPEPQTAQRLLDAVDPVTLSRDADGVPGWTVRQGDRVIGYLASTWEVAGSVGYSGRPLDVLVAITPQAVIAGAVLMRNDEPILTLGIRDSQIADYVAAFRGYDLKEPVRQGEPDPHLPDVISRATVSTGVIRDGILRTARALAGGRGLIAGAGGIDRISFVQTGWQGLIETGALAETRVPMSEAARALAGAQVVPEPGPGDFLRLWVGIVDTPTVGQSLFGQQPFSRAMGSLGLGEAALVVMSQGAQSHRGTAWRRSGVFDRVAVVQGDVRWQPEADRYSMIRALAAEGAPEMKEISIFALPAAIDPTLPFRVEIRAARAAASGGGEVAMTIPLDYTLPAEFRAAPAAAEVPLWESVWAAKRPEIAIVATMLGVLTLILFAQETITRRPRLWLGLRLGFLMVTFLVLGIGLNGQLSVVQVVAFLHSLLTGFRWETFLIEPVIFLLWGFVALGLLFWGRGVYCGWLCPFGALQELANVAAERLGVRQIAVPQALHERLWVIKYTLFVAILALSFHSMHDAILLSEVEPFKTAISLRMVRAWPFVLFVAVLLFAGLFIERFYCRYLCPLGAGLAIPAKLKIFDWLKRRPQCGRECRLCETRCTVGAIDPLGRINVNECVLCLRCQVIMNDAATCPVLKRRARTEE